MNKYDEYPVPAIADLLEQLCPEGVPEVMLGDISEIKSGSSVSKKYIAANPGDFPVINSGKEPLGFVDSFNSKNPIGVTTRGANVGYVSWTNTPHFKGNLNYDISVNATLVNARFLFFQLKNRSEGIHALCTYGGIPALNQSALKTLTVDLPPLEVQEQIVGVLEVFTDLEASLNRELELRSIQREEYRRQSMPLDTERPLYRLDRLFKFAGGYTPSKSDPANWDGGDIPWFRVEDIRTNGRVLSDSLQHITDKGVKTSGLFPAGSLIVSTSATIGEHALITTDFLCNQRFQVLTPRPEFANQIDQKYLAYLGYVIGEFCKNNVEVGGFSNVKLPMLKGFEIPLPPLEVQEQIVNTLDMFTDYTNNLRREIDLRRQQLEHYREQLLTFPVTKKS